MEYEELRPYVLSFLRSTSDSEPLQILTVVRGVETRLQEAGFYGDQPEWLSGLTGAHRAPEEDLEKIRQIASELLNQDILVWGWNLENPGPPFLRITGYGRASLQSDEPLPHDPDGYLAYLKREVPIVDDTILVYVTEALQGFLRGLMLSSTVMLGAAAEKAFLLLIEAYTNSITDLPRKERFVRKTSGVIKRKLDGFRSEVPSFRTRLPSPLLDDLDIQLDGIFNLIRTCRNDAGHPTGRRIDRQLVYANLRLFVGYCKRAYGLIEFFRTNPS
jgi:hypothetical protein